MDMDKWLERLDLDKNGLSAVVSGNIKKYRTGDFRVSVREANSAPVVGAKLTVKQVSHDFKFGSNAFMAGGFETAERNATYDAVFKNTFNQAVLPFYWKDDEPQRGIYRFDKNSPPIHRRPNPEFMLEWCKKVEVEPKAHNLVWDGSGLPEWLPRTPESLDPQLTLRIKELAKRFADKIPVWDVVNEFLSRDRRSFRKDCHIYYFKLAQELFPNCELIANEDTERTWDAFTGDSSRFYLYLQHLLLSGCKVDGIGMQYHLFSKKEVLHERLNTSLNAENLLACQSFYATFGKDIHISEISIPSYNEPGKGEEIQARMTENLFKIWFSGEQNRSIVWWNLVDGYASQLLQWGWDENIFGAGLFRKDLTPKPAFLVAEHLINKEWHTEQVLATDQNGYATFNGFHGKYLVTIEKNGHKTEIPMHFNKAHSSCSTQI
jgi:GH35 family endo-1,4-beta-xylanase